MPEPRYRQEKPLSIRFLLKADSLRKERKFAEAEEVCYKGLLKFPDLLAGRFLYAQINYHLGKQEKARKSLLTVLRNRPDHGGAIKLMCRLLIELKEFSRAAEMAEIGLLFHPQDTVIKKLAYYCNPKWLAGLRYIDKLEKLQETIKTQAAVI